PPRVVTPFPYTTLFRSDCASGHRNIVHRIVSPGFERFQVQQLRPNLPSKDFNIDLLIRRAARRKAADLALKLLQPLNALRDCSRDRKSTRLNSSHEWIS